MKFYIKKPTIQGAWMWILEGYRLAWLNKGYDVRYFNDIEELSNENNFNLMLFDWDLFLKKESYLKVFENSNKTFLFVQPNNFPKPWGTHPNFISCLDKEYIDKLNSIKNIKKWTILVQNKEDNYFSLWNGSIETIHFAYDSINYEKLKKYDKSLEFDLCYVGSWANNGFDEKKQIMIKYFTQLKNSGLNCGLFINKKVTVEQEASLLYSSKMGFNVHDNYARTLKLDLNERCFKTLGINGLSASDMPYLINSVLPDINTITSEHIDEMIQKTKLYLEKYSSNDIKEIKQNNINIILKNHTYCNRIEQMENI